MLIHLLTPRGLSWTRNGVPKTTEAHDRLKAEKRNATPEMLCRGLPFEFEEFLSYTRRLAFKDCPDYDRWVERFRDLGKDFGYENVDEFIWPPPTPVVSAAIPYTSLLLNGVDRNLSRKPQTHLCVQGRRLLHAMRWLPFLIT